MPQIYRCVSRSSGRSVTGTSSPLSATKYPNCNPSGLSLLCIISASMLPGSATACCSASAGRNTLLYAFHPAYERKATERRNKITPTGPTPLITITSIRLEFARDISCTKDKQNAPTKHQTRVARPDTGGYAISGIQCVGRKANRLAFFYRHELRQNIAIHQLNKPKAAEIARPPDFPCGIYSTVRYRAAVLTSSG